MHTPISCMPWSPPLTLHAHAKQCTGGTTHPAAAHGSARHAHQLHTRANISHCTRTSSPLVWVDQQQHMHAHQCHQQHALTRVGMQCIRISSTQWHANQPHTVARASNAHKRNRHPCPCRTESRVWCSSSLQTDPKGHTAARWPANTITEQPTPAMLQRRDVPRRAPQA
jgi:hypothetical protein